MDLIHTRGLVSQALAAPRHAGLGHGAGQGLRGARTGASLALTVEQPRHLMTPHRFTCRVYYEDTDMAGIVYHANYLKFVERARSEWVRGLGVDQGALKDGAGRVFAVRDMQADFLRPARLDDLLEVTTALDGAEALRGARLRLRQEVWRGADCVFTATLTLICMTLAGRAVRFPDDFRQQIASWGENAAD